MNIAKIIGFSFIITATAFAEIGQTETQIEAKYGKPVGVVPNNPPVPGITRSYNFAGYLIEVTFLNRTCMMETFSKNGSERMHLDDISALLLSYNPGHKWTYQGNQGTDLQYWVRDDLYLVASFSSLYSKVSISTPEFFGTLGVGNTKRN